MISETPIEIETFELTENLSHSELEIEENTASEIIANLAIPVSIELSRTKLSLKELGALRNGQIIELSKRPGDLVDLIVSGKKIGNGELVDIDGELGVRIASLVE